MKYDLKENLIVIENEDDWLGNRITGVVNEIITRYAMKTEKTPHEEQLLRHAKNLKWFYEVVKADKTRLN